MSDRREDTGEARIDDLLRCALGAADAGRTESRNRPSEDDISAYLLGTASAAQVRTVREAMLDSAEFQAEMLAQSEALADLSDPSLADGMAAVEPPSALWRKRGTAAAASRSRPHGRAGWFGGWSPANILARPAPAYALAAAALIALVMLQWPRDDFLMVPHYSQVRGADDVPELIVPASPTEVELRLDAPVPDRPDLRYRAVLRQLPGNEVVLLVARSARVRKGDGGHVYPTVLIAGDALEAGSIYEFEVTIVAPVEMVAEQDARRGRFRVDRP